MDFNILCILALGVLSIFSMLLNLVLALRLMRKKVEVTITNDPPNSEVLKGVYDAWHKKKIINEYQTVFLGVGGVPVRRVPNELLD